MLKKSERRCKVLLTGLSLVLSSCGNVSPQLKSQTETVQLPPLPAWVEAEASKPSDFGSTMRSFLFDDPTSPTFDQKP